MELFDDNLIGDEQMYMENILDHSKHPHNAGTIPDATIMHREVNTSCGDTVNLYVTLQEGRVLDVKFDGHGCAISQAGVSMLTDHIKGKTVEELRALTKEDIFALLGIKVGMTRLRCALLGLRTLEVGLEEHLKEAKP
jgi:nitrogen fixation NifU-like protein